MSAIDCRGRDSTYSVNPPLCPLRLLTQVAQDVLHALPSSAVGKANYALSPNPVMSFRLTAVRIAFSIRDVLPQRLNGFPEAPDLPVTLTVEIKRHMNVVTVIFTVF